jgi:DNA repair exonuclease SbcCD nuclease subunit
VRDEWDYIALGDWHLYTQIAPNALYSGATEFTSTNIWEESGKPKGWILYDASTRTHEFHPVHTRAVFDLLPIDAAELSAAELNAAIEARADALGESLSGAIVRQRVWNLHPDLRRQIDGELLRELKARALLLLFRSAHTAPKRTRPPPRFRRRWRAPTHPCRRMATLRAKLRTSCGH